MTRPHWTRLGMPQGRCGLCRASLPVAPALVWWTGDDLACRACAVLEGAEPPAMELLD